MAESQSLASVPAHLRLPLGSLALRRRRGNASQCNDNQYNQREPAYVRSPGKGAVRAAKRKFWTHHHADYSCNRHSIPWAKTRLLSNVKYLVCVTYDSFIPGNAEARRVIDLRLENRPILTHCWSQKAALIRYSPVKALSQIFEHPKERGWLTDVCLPNRSPIGARLD